MIQYRMGPFRLYSGSQDEVISIGGRSVVNRIHTHAGLGSEAAEPSIVDLTTHVLHREAGGGGVLQILYRDAHGAARIQQLNYGDVRTMLDLYRLMGKGDLK